MSEDLTKKLPMSDSDQLSLILKAVQRLEARFEKLEARVENIDARLQRLEQIVEQRLYDTRPIWHRLVDDIGKLQVGQQRLEEGQEGLRREVRELSGAVREVSRDQIVINDVIRKIRLDFHNIDERLHGIELNRKPSNSQT